MRSVAEHVFCGLPRREPAQPQTGSRHENLWRRARGTQAPLSNESFDIVQVRVVHASEVALALDDVVRDGK
jgi:hypothetical protein